MNKKFLTGFFTIMSLGSAAVQAEVNACGKQPTLEQKVQKTLDIAEIQNVTSAHAYYHGATMHQAEIEKIWSKRDDITWTNNTDRYNNRKSVWTFYVENSKQFPLKGSMAYHMLTTPIVEVADDGKTAKAIYMSFGNVSGIIGPNNFAAMWTQEKYGMDLIKENGKWKIWHLRTYVDFYTPVGKNWLNTEDNLVAMDVLKLQGKKLEETKGATVNAEPGFVFKFEEPDEKKVFYEGYTKERIVKLAPELPQPYCTWSDIASKAF
ncbi:nuclear transport factor 2 family protein [Acinetobacter baylyi]|uniref:nuclear transport factor 2 family protein n=1 Tax=Acinetobacter baylyi TaxID=202950 RepID=UPI0013C4069F|nr:nuclear transport factor 2 family protein [Acinetobacter baylyi]